MHANVAVCKVLPTEFLDARARHAVQDTRDPLFQCLARAQAMEAVVRPAGQACLPRTFFPSQILIDPSGEHEAWVDRHGNHTFPLCLQSSIELDRVKDVGHLGLPVRVQWRVSHPIKGGTDVLESYAGMDSKPRVFSVVEVMGGASDVDHSGFGSGFFGALFEQRQEQIGQVEVSQVVGGELHFHAIFVGAERTHAHGCVVDEYVHLSLFRPQCFGEPFDRFSASQVAFDGLYVRVRHALHDPLFRSFPSFPFLGGKHHVCALFAQRRGHLLTQARRRTSDDHVLSMHLVAVQRHHLCAGGGRSEAICRRCADQVRPESHRRRRRRACARRRRLLGHRHVHLQHATRARPCDDAVHVATAGVAHDACWHVSTPPAALPSARAREGAAAALPPSSEPRRRGSARDPRRRIRRGGCAAHGRVRRRDGHALPSVSAATSGKLRPRQAKSIARRGVPRGRARGTRQSTRTSRRHRRSLVRSDHALDVSAATAGRTRVHVQPCRRRNPSQDGMRKPAARVVRGTGRALWERRAVRARAIGGRTSQEDVSQNGIPHVENGRTDDEHWKKKKSLAPEEAHRGMNGQHQQKKDHCTSHALWSPCKHF
mmetsp:Transcript_5783/g.35913  ORF Transcript_5783/g.35913 Transcript_5783/m.35913 type:complete len:599 (-) Transcript_5783:1059-2855(-)